jgi:hypothetical protein
MQKKCGHNSRRLIVYVDAQLRYSKRFDVEGIQQEHPEFFAPLPKRRTSNSSGISGHSTPATNGAEAGEEGQLRFWTSEMCTRSPHLFDFVVTVCISCLMDVGHALTFSDILLSLEVTEPFCSRHGYFKKLFLLSFHSRWVHWASSPTLTLMTIERLWMLP